MPRGLSNTQRFRTARTSFWGRLFLISVALVAFGWIWPYELSSLPEYLSNTGWVLGWFTVLVLIGTVGGYVLRSRWSILAVPVALYAGGLLHWFQFEWGFSPPPWPLFGLASGLAFGVLLITAGASAGIASRVIAAGVERGRPAQGIRQSAALAPLLGLIAITSIYVLPMPFIGALLGLAAVLAGIGLMEDEQVNFRERILGIAGMLVGVVAIGTHLYALWSLIRDFF